MLKARDSRQSPLVALVEFGPEDFVSGVLEAAVEIPGGAFVKGGSVNIVTAFDSGTSDSLTVGDADTEDRYKGATDCQSVGISNLTPTGLVNDGPTEVTMTLTSAGAVATAGKGYLTVEYVVPGRSQSTQG